jgi:HlyD family secretion protein
LAAAATGIAHDALAKPEAASAAAKAALTVTLVQPQRIELAQAVPANGNIAAWQEASVGSESSGWRLAEVLVNVGDVVKKGQVLARFAAETAQAELAQGRAAWPRRKPRRPRRPPMPSARASCRPAAPLSAQQIQQYVTAERTAQARLDALRAAARVQQLRLAQAQVLAPDHGVISARSATVGAVVGAGQELFRLIRQGRLEWRAEVAATRPGQHPARPEGACDAGGRAPVAGTRAHGGAHGGCRHAQRSRLRGPAAAPGVKAGMYARGEFEIGERAADAAAERGAAARRLQLRLRLDKDQKVAMSARSAPAAAAGDRIEITAGLDPAARGGFGRRLPG